MEDKQNSVAPATGDDQVIVNRRKKQIVSLEQSVAMQLQKQQRQPEIEMGAASSSQMH